MNEETPWSVRKHEMAVEKKLIHSSVQHQIATIGLFCNYGECLAILKAFLFLSRVLRCNYFSLKKFESRIAI